MQIWVSCFSSLAFDFFQATLLLSQIPPDLVGEKLETERFCDAVNVILSLQVNKYIIFLQFCFVSLT